MGTLVLRLLGMGRDCWPRRNTPLLHMLSCQVRSFQVKRYNRNYVDPSEKLAPSVPPFKVIQGYWNRHGSIRCLWLPTSDPLYSRAYLVAFPRWKAISVESRKVFPPRVTLPQRKFPLDFFSRIFVTVEGLKQTRIMPLLECQKVWQWPFV